MKKLLLGVLVLTVALTAAPLVSADTYLKYESHTDGFSMMGQTQPPKDDFNTMWLSKEHALINQGGESSVLVNIGDNKMYIINHKEKNYAEMEMGDLSSMIGEKEMSDKEKEQFNQLMASMMQLKATVTKTDQTKKIEKWNSTLYTVTTKMAMGATDSNIWASNEIKVDSELYLALTNAMLSKQPGFEEFMKEMMKIDGVPVLKESTTEVMGTKIKSTEKLVEFKDTNPPADTYMVPKDYKKSKSVMNQ
ncbi:hypothetical protein JW905_07685 [bacterium]|nr:hypothetical protein [candidate division CSSED10-310 bacterium]